nr:formate dehydrogenase gamma subunit [Desulfovibrio vulgaris, Hildenborough, Peptide Partial, 15 aa] [Nitratidesulfovibrio vulgaris]
ADAAKAPKKAIELKH